LRRGFAGGRHQARCRSRGGAGGRGSSRHSGALSTWGACRSDRRRDRVSHRRPPRGVETRTLPALRPTGRPGQRVFLRRSSGGRASARARRKDSATCPGATWAPRCRRELHIHAKHTGIAPAGRLGDVRMPRPACRHPPAIASSGPVHSRADCSKTGKKIVTGIWDIVQGWSRPTPVALEWVWLITVCDPCGPTAANGKSSRSSRVAARTRGQCIGRAGCNQHALPWLIQPGDTTRGRPQPRKPGTTAVSDGVTLAILP